MNARVRVLILSAAVAATIGLTMLACVPNMGANSANCPAEDPSAMINVNGFYQYTGDSLLKLRGSITFEQQGNMVRITDTTYDNSGDRRLKSDLFALQGNKLVASLVPQNGDTDYRADVTFIFSEDAQRFCVEFNDTNGDSGRLGTYTGLKQ